MSGTDFLIHITASSPLSKARRRWRFAYVAIYSCRAIDSLANDIVSRKCHTMDIVTEQPVIFDFKKDEAILSAPTPFFPLINQAKLTKMVKEKDMSTLRRLGGVEAIAEALESGKGRGIIGDDRELEQRKMIFGSNTYIKPPRKGLFYFVMEALKDTTILILLVCAALSLGFGVKEHGVQEGWYEGGSIYVAVFLVVVVSALSNFRQELQFEKLSNISNNIQVDVLRDGRRQEISIFDIVVGDIGYLSIGDQVPADGLLLEGHSLQVDESSMTGESDHVEVNSQTNPFLFSGSKVADGHGQFLVSSVGMNTTWGETMSSISKDSNESTLLQSRLDNLTSAIGKAGLVVAFLVLAVLLLRYFTGNTEDKDGNREFVRGRTSTEDVINAMITIVSAAVTIVVIAIPEGLPLAVTLTLAYSMKRMMSDQAMVRNLSACETMGSATVICTDKTGTLTMNQMKVTKFWLGGDQESSMEAISRNIIALFHQGIGLNTTASVYMPPNGAQPEFSGSPTEKAILSWAVEALNMNMESIKQSYTIIKVKTFNSEKKRSGVLIKWVEDGDESLYVQWKGAAEMILQMCSTYCTSDGTVRPLDEDDERSRIEEIIRNMAASSLRCIAFCCKRIIETEEFLESGLMFLGIVGLKDPCRLGVKKAVEACKNAHVEIKMITGDNVFTAKAIATECGILEPDHEQIDGSVVEGFEFRNYTHEERIQKVDRIKVMARSSPSDKLLMVQCLKQKGHVVAVTGDGTNDAPALKEADIGLSMGIQGTEVAKESSDIVILDDDFASVFTVLKWGRCVYNNIQKFLQFQLTINVAALVINFIAAVSSGKVPLTVVQLLWVNLIQDTLAALALATERPTNELMKKTPIGRTEPLITNIMWRNLLSQALYQITILLVLQFKGESIFDVNSAVNDTMIFNTFVLCQVFNEFNSRSLEKVNVFKGVLGNKLFIGIVAITVVLQILMVELLKEFADTERLNWGQWVICTALAAVSWPIGLVVKLVPVSDTPLFSSLEESRTKLTRTMKRIYQKISLSSNSSS